MSLIAASTNIASNLPPVAVIFASPDQPVYYAGDLVIFSAEDSYGQGGYIDRYEWYVNGTLERDPMASMYPGISPFAYVLNNPVNLIDPTGMVPECIQRDEDGYCTDWEEREVILITAERDQPASFAFRMCPFMGKSNITRSEFTLNQLSYNQIQQTQNQPMQVSQDDQNSQASLLDCVADCAGEQLGIHSAMGALAALSGQPLLSTRGKLSGSVPGTSPAARSADAIFGKTQSPVRLSTVTGGPGSGQPVRITSTLRVARFAGRAVPVLGWGIIVYDAASIGFCINDCLSN